MKRIVLAHDHQAGPWERKQFLERSGFAVELSTGGEACLALVERCRPDLVLLDVLLDGANGFELCRQLRTRYDVDELPILICGGIYRGADFEGEARDVGAQSFLESPLDPRSLIESIVSHVHDAEPEPESVS